MTGAATGFPDWQAFSSLHGAALYDGNTIIPAGGTGTLVQVDSSSYAGVHISIVGNTGGGTLTLLSGETASNVVDDIAGQWIVRPETRIEVTAPLPRGRLTISLSASAAAIWDFNARVALTNVAVDRHHYYGAGNIVAANNIAIGAGVLQTYYPTTLVPGPAHLWLYNAVPANMLEATVRTRATDGTADLYVAQIQSAVAIANQDLIVPTRIYQVDIRNLGAGANTYYFSLCTTGMQT